MVLSEVVGFFCDMIGFFCSWLPVPIVAHKTNVLMFLPVLIYSRRLYRKAFVIQDMIILRISRWPWWMQSNALWNWLRFMYCVVLNPVFSPCSIFMVKQSFRYGEAETQWWLYGMFSGGVWKSFMMPSYWFNVIPCKRSRRPLKHNKLYEVMTHMEAITHTMRIKNIDQVLLCCSCS